MRFLSLQCWGLESCSTFQMFKALRIRHLIISIKCTYEHFISLPNMQIFSLVLNSSSVLLIFLLRCIFTEKSWPTFSFLWQNKSKNVKPNVKQIFTITSRLIFSLQSQYSYMLQFFPLTLSCLLFDLSLNLCLLLEQYFTTFHQIKYTERPQRIAMFLFSIKFIKVSSKLSQFIFGKLCYNLSSFPFTSEFVSFPSKFVPKF